KVRMNRVLLMHILPSISILNFIKYKWFTYSYLGHRTSRYLLWISHLLLYIANLILAFPLPAYRIIFILHSIIWLIALLAHYINIPGKVSILIHYYATTILAQWLGVINILTGKAKPFWEKAESTR